MRLSRETVRQGTCASAFCFPIKCSEQGQATGKWNNARCATSIGELVDGGQTLTALVITSKVNLSWLRWHNKVCKFTFRCPGGVHDINRCPRYWCMSLVYAEPCWAMLSLHVSWPVQGGHQNSLCKETVTRTEIKSLKMLLLVCYILIYLDNLVLVTRLFCYCVM